MTTFDNREHAYENKFAHDQETEFNIIARRNKLLGLWASQKMSLDENDTKNYTNDLVTKTAQKDSVTCIVQQIISDFTIAQLSISKEEVEQEMSRLLQIARDQVINIG